MGAIWVVYEIRKTHSSNLQSAIDRLNKLNAEQEAKTEKLKQAVNTAEGNKL